MSIEITDELAAEFAEVLAEVEKWEPWQRSLDPQGAASPEKKEQGS
jgi:hypothetical protein